MSTNGHVASCFGVPSGQRPNNRLGAEEAAAAAEEEVLKKMSGGVSISTVRKT